MFLLSTQSVHIIHSIHVHVLISCLFLFIPLFILVPMFILIIMYVTQRAMTNEKKKSQRAVSKNLDQHDGIQSITFKDSVCIDSILSCQS